MTFSLQCQTCFCGECKLRGTCFCGECNLRVYRSIVIKPEETSPIWQICISYIWVKTLLVFWSQFHWSLFIWRCFWFVFMTWNIDVCIRYVVATLPFLLFLYAELHTMLMYATACTLGCVLMTWIQMIPLGTYNNIWPPDCSIKCIECDIHLNHAIWYCALYDKLLSCQEPNICIVNTLIMAKRLVICYARNSYADRMGVSIIGFE